MNKDKMEEMCRKANMRPEARERIQGDYELFLADGFSLAPHKAFWKFGVEPEEFPHGMYATQWWLSKGSEKLNIGQFMFFDAFHNPELDLTSKKLARLNAARKDAKICLERMKKNAQPN